MDTANNTLYIHHTGAHTVMAWKSMALTGHIIAGSNYTTGATNSLLDQPYGIARDPNGNLYVSDSMNDRVLLFCQNPSTTNGRTIVETYNYPTYIAFDSKLNLYVF